MRHFSYEPLGNVTRATDRHREVHYAYRGMGRLVSRTGVGTSVEFGVLVTT